MTDERKIFYVYGLLREDGSPFYIGKGVRNRHRRHLCPYSKGANPRKDAIIDRLARAGREPEVVFYAKGLAEADAYSLEAELIAKFGRKADGGILTNITEGGDGPPRITPEIRKKISEGLKGRRHSEETRAKLSAARRLRVTTDETRAKMSASQKKRLQDPEALARHSNASKGRKQSQETIDKRRSKMEKHYQSEEWRARMKEVQTARSSRPDYLANLSAGQRRRRERERAEAAAAAEAEGNAA